LVTAPSCQKVRLRILLKTKILYHFQLVYLFIPSGIKYKWYVCMYLYEYNGTNHNKVANMSDRKVQATMYVVPTVLTIICPKYYKANNKFIHNKE
jgi:hypothetical protein